MRLMKVLGLLLIIILSPLTNQAQQERCNFDSILEQQLQDSVFARNFNTVLNTLSNQPQRASSTETLTIPIVVHVFHDGDNYSTGSNISDEVIYDAIASLNAAFAGDPWHTTSHSGVTHPYSDSNIEFCLASIDPDGNPTNGITRQNPDTISGYTENGMVTNNSPAPNSEGNLKLLCYWPVQTYCNIYVVHKLNGGISPLGFAYLPPTGNAYYDGVVCVTPSFGYEPPISINNYDKNGTLIHEMGHYLGLFHTFTGTSSCSPETNCNSQGDRLCDTPPTTGTIGCTPINCPETMVENFMDYSNDNCMDRFSPDGITRMRTQILQWRSSLIDDDNLACGVSEGVDAKVGNILTPNIGCSPILSEISYELKSLASDPLTEATINYTINGLQDSIVWVGNLGLGESEIITLPDYEIGYEYINITIEVDALNDINPENNTATTQFDNYEGVYVDIIVEWDALPYGVDIGLLEADDNGNPIGEAIFLYENEDNNLSCTVDTFNLCLFEGNYTLIANDALNNGFSYPCQFVERCIWVEVNGEIVGNALCGSWDSGDNILFTIELLGCNSNTCYGDVNGDGLVGALDITTVLQYFGSTVEPCSPYDVNQNGIVGVNDILDILNNFNFLCSEVVNTPIENIESFIKSEEETILNIDLYNLQGQKVTNDKFLPPGIYIKVNRLLNQKIITEKIYIGQ